jgi:hypothetical protein
MAERLNARREERKLSSIFDRLKQVEGATFGREARADKSAADGPCPQVQTSRTRPTGPNHLTCPKSAWSGVTPWLCRLLPGFLALLLVVVVWRPWGSQSPLGKPLSQPSRLTVAVSRNESPQPRPDASALKEHQNLNPENAEPQGNAAPPLSDPSGLSDLSDRSDMAAIRTAKPENSAEPVPPAVAQDDAHVKAFLRSLTVTGVYQDATGYIAFINGRALAEGDEIGQVKIEEITSGRVTFAHQGKRYILRLR